MTVPYHENPASPAIAELRTVYEAHTAFCRMQVQLTWERMRFFIGLSVALTLLGTIGVIVNRGMLPSVGYWLGAGVALAGAYTIRKAHGYSEAERAAFERLAHAAGMDVADLAHLHRAQQRGTTVTAIALAAIAVLDLVLGACVLLT